MILSSEDMPGSMADKPEYADNYGTNQKSFVEEFQELENLNPGHTGWSNSLFLFEIYKDADGYRVAMPAKHHPVRLQGRMYFQDFLLSKTLFPNPYQARTIAARIMQERMGN